MHYIPGLRLRLSSTEAEIIGIDDAEMGEFAYDYVGIDAEIGTRSEGDAGDMEEVRGRSQEGVGAVAGKGKEEGSSVEEAEPKVEA